ncbi:hypothetical protein [Cytobacillus firmus]|uniref:hypothetical protein n=1 Tax=Cytobacillus firmus TaxID=1399 RepID=UPI0034A5CBE6
METVLKNLKYIKRTIEDHTHVEQKAILSVLLSETIEEVRETTFKYEVPYIDYSGDNSGGNLATYKDMGKRFKSKVLAELEEVQKQLNKKNTGVNRCLAILNNLINTNLYTDKVNAKIKQWKLHPNVSKKAVQASEIIEVK